MSNLGILTSDNAPAIFSRNAADNVSSRYAMVHTDLVLSSLMDLGWEISGNIAVKGRNRNNKDPHAKETAKHMIRMRHPKFPEVQGAFPEIVFTNAHDKTGAIAFYCGLLEVVCGNGLIAMRDGACFKIYHVNVNTDRIIAAATKIALQIPTIMESRKVLQSVPMSEQDSLEFASRVIDLRWDGKCFSVNPADLVKPHHAEQSDPNLWNVFNNTQNNIINGGDFVINNRVNSKTRKAQGIKQIDQKIKINTALWNTMEDFAKEKGVVLPVLSLAPPASNV